MSPRTISLLLLCIVAFGIAAVAVALTTATTRPADVLGPWRAPLLGLICATGVFFLGRHHILPREIAQSSRRALWLLTLISAGSIAAVWGVVLVVRPLIGLVPGPGVLVLWFGAMWWAVRAVHRSATQPRLPL